MMSNASRLTFIASAVAAVIADSACAVVIQDDLNGASSSYPWIAINGACLTAGNGSGTIPGCTSNGFTYYSNRKSTPVGGATGTLPDPVGAGALRLTNGDRTKGSNGNYQNGAVVSDFTFPMQEGLQVTFSTVTYGGNGFRGTGADGISFFLADGSRPASVGASGGSLGYSCSNGNAASDGVAGGYIGVGIDEYGNFSNVGDNTSSGPGQKANRVSIRGSGNTNWANLLATYHSYYKDVSTANITHAVSSTCRAGYVRDWRRNKDNGSVADLPLLHNYNFIAASDLPKPIANQQAMAKSKRGDAVPIVYSLKLTQGGLLSMSYSYNGGAATPIIKDRDIKASNGPMPRSFRFGFAASTGAGSNVHEITCFKAEPIGQSSSSAGTNVQQSARVEAGSQVYLAYYHPTNWWGELSAQDLLYDPATDSVSISTTANWNASCVLTGGDCPSTGGTTTAQAPARRKILTWSGSAGIPLRWDGTYTPPSAIQALLTAGDASPTNKRLNYLRGDRTNEITSTGSGLYRARTGVLGDIIDSSPTWVGAPASPYSGPWVDALYKTATPVEPNGSYDTFKKNHARRQNIVYVGANDGMLHGFRTGYYDAGGTFVRNDAGKPNDGSEAIAYMPGAVLKTIHSPDATLDFSSTQYVHNHFVDATPGVGDLYYQNAWHTWLVGGLGPGANANGPAGDRKTAATGGAIYALDITNPAGFADDASTANALVVGEWDNTLQCVGDSGCGVSLGNTYGTPVIRRLHNGNWAVLFGNGLNSASGSAGLFVMLVNPADGSKSFLHLDTGYGPARDPVGKNNKNGIAYVTPVDLDGDHITDYVYAGDAFGNVWRFDLTSNNPAAWSVSPRPLLATGLPITSKVVVASVPGSGSGADAAPRVMVSFGTGRRLEQTQSSQAVFETASQALFGVWDWNMTGWNAMAARSARYAALASAPQPLTPGSLTGQRVTNEGRTSANTAMLRTVSANRICWQGSTACSSGNARYGWQLPLSTGRGEQVIY
ncbi:MAG: pilus assembly protein PilY, partial [Cupriavidus sp.]|nr:pilus assembly protein PilY [Cupriavidus sp.]